MHSQYQSLMQKIVPLILSVYLLFSGFGNSVQGQIVSLGTGTAVNGTQVSSPVNIWYRRCVNQTVYTVAELNAAGITGPATIRQLGYYVTQAPIYAIPGYQISMKHTTANNASGNLEGGYTVVKSASNYTPKAMPLLLQKGKEKMPLHLMLPQHKKQMNSAWVLMPGMI